METNKPLPMPIIAEEILVNDVIRQGDDADDDEEEKENMLDILMGFDDDSADDEDKILRSMLMTIVLCDDGENELTDRAKDPKRRKRRCTMMECVLQM